MTQKRHRLPISRKHLLALFIILAFLFTGTILAEKIISPGENVQVLGTQTEE